MYNNHMQIKWSVKEHKKINKSKDWFIAGGIVVFAVAVASVFLGNFLFGVLSVVAFATLYLISKHEPGVVDVVIDESGIRLGNVAINYDSLEKFWINNDTNTLKILSKNIARPYLQISVPYQLKNQVREALQSKAKEEDFEAPVYERLADMLGF